MLLLFPSLRVKKELLVSLVSLDWMEIWYKQQLTVNPLIKKGEPLVRKTTFERGRHLLPSMP